MKHLPLLFALLATVVGGAWAQSAIPADPNQYLAVTNVTTVGDMDNFQVVFFEVPDSITSTIYFAIEDPGSPAGFPNEGLANDPNEHTYYTLIGGSGALTDATSRYYRYVGAESPYAGTTLDSLTFLAEAGSQEGWEYFAGVQPSQGEHIGNKYYFKVVAEYQTGGDPLKNGFRLSADYDNVGAPAGIATINAFAYSWTLAMYNTGRNWLSYPLVPQGDSGNIVFSNWDMDSAAGPDETGSATSPTPAVTPLTISNDGVIANTSAAIGGSDTGTTWTVDYYEGTTIGYVNPAVIYAWNSATAINDGTTLPDETSDRIYRSYASAYTPLAADHISATVHDGSALSDGNDTEQVTLQVVDINGDPVPYSVELFVQLSGSAQFETSTDATPSPGGFPTNTTQSLTTDLSGLLIFTISDAVTQLVTITITENGSTLNNPANNDSPTVDFVANIDPVITSTANTSFVKGSTASIADVRVVDLDGGSITSASGVRIVLPAALVSAGVTFDPNATETVTMDDTASGPVTGVMAGSVTYNVTNTVAIAGVTTPFGPNDRVTIGGLTLIAPAGGASSGSLGLSFNGDNTADVTDDKLITIYSSVATWTGATSQNWNDATNWDVGTVPGISGSTDTYDVVIPDVSPNPEPVADVNIVLNDLTIDASASLDLAARNLTVNGTISNDGTLLLQGTQTVTLTNGNDTNSGEVAYDGTVGGTIGIPAFYDLRVNGSGTFALSATTTVARDVLLDAGNLSTSGHPLTVTRNIDGSALGTGNLVATGTETIQVSGDFTPDGFTSATSTVQFSGGNAQATNGLTFRNLTLSKSAGTLSANGSIVVAGVLARTAGTLAMAANTLTVQGNVSYTAGSLTSTGALAFSGGSGQAVNLTSATLANMVVSKSGGTATISTNVALSGSLTRTSGNLSMGTNSLTIAGDISWTAGNLTGVALLTLNGAGAQAINLTNATVTALTLNKSGGTATVGSAITLSGTLTRTAGALDMQGNALSVAGNIAYAAGSLTSAGLVTLNGTGAQAIDFTNATLADLTIAKTAGTTATAGSDISLSGSLTRTSGNLAMGAFTLSVGGNVAWTAGNLTSSGVVTLNGAGAQAVNFSSSTLSALTVDKSGGTATAGSAITLSGALTRTAGTLDMQGNALWVSGNIAYTAGTLNSSGTVTLAGGNAQAVNLTNATLANLTVNKSANTATTGAAIALGGNLTMTAGGFTLGADADIAGNVALNGGTFTPGANTVSVAGNWAKGAGTFAAAGSTVRLDTNSSVSVTGSTAFATLEVISGLADSTKSVTFATGSTQTASQFTATGAAGQLVTLTGAGGWTINAASASVTYANVNNSTATTAITATTSKDSGSNVNWTFTAALLTWNAGTATSSVWTTASNWDRGYVPNTTDDILVTGTPGNTPSIPNTQVMHNLTINTTSGTTTSAGSVAINGDLAVNGGGLTLSGNADVAGSVSIGGGTFTPGANTVYVGGDWTYASGTFTSTGSTVEFDGTVAQALTTGGAAFASVRANGTNTVTTSGTLTATGSIRVSSGGLTLGADADVTGNVTIDGGTLSPGANAISLGGNWSRTTGTFSAGTSLVTFDGTGAQTSTSGGQSFASITVNKSAGTMAFSDATTATGTITVTNSGGTTFANSLNVPSVVLTDTTGTIAFQGNTTISTGLSAAANTYNVSFTGTTDSITGNTTFNNNGNVTLGDGTGDGITFGGITAFSNSGTVILGAGGDTITFTGGVTATTPSSKSVGGTVRAAGTGVINLGTSAVNVTANSTIGWTSTGTITLGDVTLANGVTLTVGAGAATPVSAGAITGPGAAPVSNVTINTSGAVSVGGAVGSNIGTFRITNSGGATFSSTFDAANVVLTATTGTVAFQGDTSISTGLATTGAAYDVSFTGTTDSIAGNTTFSNAGNVVLGDGTGDGIAFSGITAFSNSGTVTLGAGGDTITFTGGVTATTPSGKNVGGVVQAAGTGVINLGTTAVNVTDDSTIGGTSTGTITLGATTLADGVTLTVGTGAAANIVAGAMSGTAGAPSSDVTIDTAGTVGVSGAVGTDIGTFTVINSGGTTFSSTFDAADVVLTATTGTIAFQGNTSITNSLTTGGTYNVSFTGSTNSVAGATTSFGNSGSVTFGSTTTDTITFAGDVATNSGPGQTYLAGALAATDANITLGAATLNADSTITSGTGTTTLAAVTLAGNDFVVTGDEIDIGGNVASALAGANVTLQPSTISLDISIGPASSGAELDLSAVELGRLQNGLASITIGQTAGTGTVTVGAATSFQDPVTIQANGATGTIVVTDVLSGTDNASLTLTSQGITMTGGTLQTYSQTIDLSAAATLDLGGGTNTIDTTTSGASAAGTDISLAAVSNTAANSTLVLNAGTSGTIAVSGDIVLDNGTTTVRIVQSAGAAFAAGLQAGTFLITDSTGTVEVDGTLDVSTLTTTANAYAVSILGTGSYIANAVTFNNSGLVTIGDGNNEDYTFAAGIVSTAGPKRIQGTLQSNSGSIDLSAGGALTLAGGSPSVTVDTTHLGTGANIILPAIVGAGVPLTLNAGVGSIAFAGQVGVPAGRIGALTISAANNVAGDVGATAAASAIYAASATQSVGTGTSRFAIVDLTGAMSLATTAAIEITGAVTAPGGFSSAGTTFDSGATITATNNPIVLNHTGNVTIGGTLTAGTGAVNIDATGAGATVALNAPISVSTGAVTIDSVGATTVAAGANINASSSGTVDFGGSALGGTLTTSGNVSTGGGSVTFTSATTLGAGITVTTGAGAGNVTFSSTLDGGQTLGITAGAGSVLFSDTVGPLDAITISSASGGVTANGTLTATSMSITNGGPVDLNDTVTMTTGTFSSAGTTFDSTGAMITTSTNDQAITIDHTGAIIVGATLTTNGSGAVNIDATGAGATIALNAPINVDTGTVTLDSVGTTSVAAAGDITATGAAAVTFGGSALGGGLQTAGDVTTVNGNVTFASSTTLSGDVAVSTSGGDVGFGNVLHGAGAYGQGLTIDTAGGDVSFSGAIGTAALGLIHITNPSNVTVSSTLAADRLWIEGSTGTITLNGASTLRGNTTPALDLSGAAVTINAGVNTLAGGLGGQVDITHSGILTIAALADMSLDGSFVEQGAGTVTTAGDITTNAADVTFNTAVTLNGAVAIDTGAGAGNVTFNSTLDGGQTLGITAGTGSVLFDAATGTTALDAITISTASDVTTSSTLRAVSMTITNGGAVALNGAVTMTTGAFSSTGTTFTSAPGATITTQNAAGQAITIDHSGNVNVGATLTTSGSGAVNIDATGAGATIALDAPINVNAGTVTLDAVGTTTVAAAGDVTATGAATVTFGGAALGGGLQTAGDISTDGGPVTLTNSTTLAGSITISTGTGAAVTIDDDIDDAGAAGTHDLTIDSGTGDTVFGGGIGGNTALNDVSVSAGGVTFDGTGNSGADDIDVHQFNIFGATGGIVVSVPDNSQWNSTLLFSWPSNLYIDMAQGVVLTFAQDLTIAGHVAFFSGTLNIPGRTFTIGDDLAIFGDSYSADDLDVPAVDARFAYPEGIAAVSAPTFTYTPVHGDHAAFALPGGLYGTTIHLSGATANFYLNGADMVGGSTVAQRWSLVLPDQSAVDPVYDAAQPIVGMDTPFAVALNATIDYSDASGGYVAAARSNGLANNGTSYGTNNNNDHWDFDPPTILQAETVYDDTIRLWFSDQLFNVNDQLQTSVATDGLALVNNGATAFMRIQVDTSTDQDALPLALVDTFGHLSVGDSTTKLFLVSPVSWNTDAHDNSAGDPASTDEHGVVKSVIPDIDVQKGAFFDRLSRNLSITYAGAGNRYQTTQDMARPAVVAVVAAAAPHTTTVASLGDYDGVTGELYDGHNYFEIQYSEPVTIGGLLATSRNERAESSFGATEWGGSMSESSGTVNVLGYFSYPGTFQGGTVDGDPAASALYRNSETEFNPDGTHYVTVVVKGYYKPLTDPAPNAWVGYIGDATDPGKAPAETITVQANPEITDSNGNEVLAGALSVRYPVTVTKGTDVGKLDWDVDPPVLAPFEPYATASDYHEIVVMSRDVTPPDINPQLTDRIEMHFLDNGSDANLPGYSSTNSVPPDPEPLPKIDMSGLGIRDYLFQSALDAGAFTLDFEGTASPRALGTGISTFDTDVVGPPPTGFNVFFNDIAGEEYDDMYVGVDISEAQRAFPQVASLELAYASSDDAMGAVNLVTDLAGNRMKPFQHAVTIEQIPPRISAALAIAGTNRIYIRFSEWIYGALGMDILSDPAFDVNNYLEIVDSNGVDPPELGATQFLPSFTLTPDRQAVTRASGKQVLLDGYLTLASGTVTQEGALTWHIKMKGGTYFEDEYTTKMVDTEVNRVTDVALGVVEPVEAWNNIQLEPGDQSYGTEFTGLVSAGEFDGSGVLLGARDTTVQARIASSVNEDRTVELYYDLNVPDKFLTPAGSPEAPNRYWLPTDSEITDDPDTPEAETIKHNSEARRLLPISVDGLFREFEIPGDDSELKGGSRLEMTMTIDGLPAANYTDVNDPRSVIPWFVTLRQFVRQRGGVTIMNNVIYPENGEQTLIEYEIPRASNVSIIVFTLDGQVVKTLVHGRVNEGTYRVAWDGTNQSGQIVASGLYFIRVVGSGVDEIRKVLVAK